VIEPDCLQIITHYNLSYPRHRALNSFICLYFKIAAHARGHLVDYGTIDFIYVYISLFACIVIPDPYPGASLSRHFVHLYFTLTLFSLKCSITCTKNDSMYRIKASFSTLKIPLVCLQSPSPLQNEVLTRFVHRLAHLVPSPASSPDFTSRSPTEPAPSDP